MIIASLFLIIGCKEEKKEMVKTEPLVKENVTLTKPDVNESEEAEKWLKKSIGDYFKADLGNLDKNMQKMTTPDYYEYKTDATNVDMEVDGSLTKKEFYEKWRMKFDVQKAGINTGFLITGQDWEEIKISRCKLVVESEQEWWFDVLLSDEKLKSEYPVSIEVIKENGTFLIADVWQEEPKLN